MIYHIFIKIRIIFIYLLIVLNIGCVSNSVDIYKGKQDSGRIENFDSIEIRKRHLDYLNALRQEMGLGNLTISNFLNLSLL